MYECMILMSNSLYYVDFFFIRFSPSRFVEFLYFDKTLFARYFPFYFENYFFFCWAGVGRENENED